MTTIAIPTPAASKLAALREQRKKLTERIDAKIAQTQARAAKEKRKKETQFKIITGAAAIKLAEEGKIKWEDLTSVMSPKDRMRFHIPNATTLAAMQETNLETMTLEQAAGL